jgi:hypothetical protein
MSSDSDVRIRQLSVPDNDELEVPTPRATVSGANQGTGKVARIRSSRSSGSAMTDARRAQEEKVRLSNYGQSTTFDVSFE